MRFHIPTSLYPHLIIARKKSRFPSTHIHPVYTTIAAAQPRNQRRDGSTSGRSVSLTRVAHGAADRVLAPGEEELHQLRRDEAASAGHAHALPHRLHCFRFEYFVALVATLPLKK
jgi:hypothetical protein